MPILFYLHSRVIVLDYLLPVGALPRHVVRAVLAHADPVAVAVDGNFELVVCAFYLEAGAAESQLFAYLRAREFFPPITAQEIYPLSVFLISPIHFLRRRRTPRQSRRKLFEFIRRQRQRR